jgi:7,8-dihydroneopterin aldolase/epimerase/oxygenase
LTGRRGPNTLRSVSTSSDRHLTEVALMGMRFHTCVGILPHERNAAQPLEVDVIVRHGLSSAEVLDYRVLYEATLATIEAGPSTYLELIAESLAARALAIHGVAWCRVTIRKPHVALGGPLDHASVSIERSLE